MSTQPQTKTAPAAPQTEAEKQIVRAKSLERERASLAERITANREYLRLMAKNDALDAEQTAWLNKFYPLKEKGERRSDEDIQATRDVKKEARAHVKETAAV